MAATTMAPALKSGFSHTTNHTSRFDEGVVAIIGVLHKLKDLEGLEASPDELGTGDTVRRFIPDFCHLLCSLLNISFLSVQAC